MDDVDLGTLPLELCASIDEFARGLSSHRYGGGEMVWVSGLPIPGWWKTCLAGSPVPRSW